MKPLSEKTIRRRLASLDQRMREAVSRLGHATRAIKKETEAVQSRCAHRWKRLPDPAGGPGYEYCEVCECYR